MFGLKQSIVYEIFPSFVSFYFLFFRVSIKLLSFFFLSTINGVLLLRGLDNGVQLIKLIGWQSKLNYIDLGLLYNFDKLVFLCKNVLH